VTFNLYPMIRVQAHTMSICRRYVCWYSTRVQHTTLFYFSSRPRTFDGRQLPEYGTVISDFPAVEYSDAVSTPCGHIRRTDAGITNSACGTRTRTRHASATTLRSGGDNGNGRRDALGSAQNNRMSIQLNASLNGSHWIDVLWITLVCRHGEFRIYNRPYSHGSISISVLYWGCYRVVCL